MDVYSVGAMIFELIFPNNLVEYRPEAATSFKEYVRNGTHYDLLKSMP